MPSSQERIHLFYFIHDLAPYGAQRAVLYTVQKLDKKTFRVTVCSFGGDETLAPEFVKAGGEVVFLRARRFLDPAAWVGLTCLVLRVRPDIIHTTLPELGVPVRLLSLLLSRTAIVHGFQNPLTSEPGYWRFLNGLTLGICDAVTFSSKGIVDEVIRKAPALKGRFFVIPNGVELSPAPEGERGLLRKELGISESEKLICCVGRLDRQKGQDILLNAMAVLASGKEQVKLALAGDGEMLAELEALSGRLGLEGKVLFLGRRSDISRILCACDIYAAPSRWESFNIALGEAMLAGRPCVATGIPGHADLLQDGITGVSVPPENVHALAAAIAGLLDNQEEAQTRASAAKKRVQAEFTSGIMAKKYEEMYLKLSGRTKSVGNHGGERALS